MKSLFVIGGLILMLDLAMFGTVHLKQVQRAALVELASVKSFADDLSASLMSPQ